MAAVLRATGLLLAGLAAWLLLAVFPGSGDRQVSGLPYVVALAAVGGLRGLRPRGHPLVTGALLAAPALLTAPWLAPRGDDDGLWVLWFPLVVVAGAVAAGACAVVAATARRPGPRR